MGQQITQWFSPQALLCCGSRNRGLAQVGTHSLPWSPAVQETHLDEQDLMFCVLLILASGDQSTLQRIKSDKHSEIKTRSDWQLWIHHKPDPSSSSQTLLLTSDL